MGRLIERLVIVVAAFGISIGVIALLSGGLLAGRDNPGVSGAGTGPGIAFRDQGNAHLRPGDLQPVYDSDPPTSGPHIPVAITRDGSALTNDQLLQALEVGDVVLLYGSPVAPGGLSGLADSVGPRFTPAVAASGQAVVLGHRAGIRGIVALAWTHMLRTGSARDPALRTFAQFWLGRGTRGH